VYRKINVRVGGDENYGGKKHGAIPNIKKVFFMETFHCWWQKSDYEGLLSVLSLS
jgi:hypothetical protein